MAKKPKRRRRKVSSTGSPPPNITPLTLSDIPILVRGLSRLAAERIRIRHSFENERASLLAALAKGLDTNPSTAPLVAQRSMFEQREASVNAEISALTSLEKMIEEVIQRVRSTNKVEVESILRNSVDTLRAKQLSTGEDTELKEAELDRLNRLLGTPDALVTTELRSTGAKPARVKRSRAGGHK